MRKNLLFYSNLDSYWYDGEKFWSRNEMYDASKKVWKEVTREKVERIAEINNTRKFLLEVEDNVHHCPNCGVHAFRGKQYAYKCGNCGWEMKLNCKVDAWSVIGLSNGALEVSVNGVPKASIRQEIVIHGLDECEPKMIKGEMFVGYVDVLEDLDILKH